MAEKRDNPPRWPNFPEQDENGVDLSLLRANLRLTPTERVRQAEARLKSNIGRADRRSDLDVDSLATPCPDPHEPTDQDRTFRPWPEQDEHGVDLSLLRAQLRLTPTERIRRGDHYRRSVLHVRQHARRIR